MNKTVKKRNSYYFKIKKYEERRINYKKLFKQTGKRKYQFMYKRITIKICYWKEAIRRIDKRTKKIKQLVKCVNRYFNVDILSNKMDTQHKLARSVFYKIGMESKLRGCWLARHLHKTDRMAQLGRKSFTKSFKTKPENREVFHIFKKYFENEIL